MKTGLEMLQDASSLLMANDVKSLINGDLYLLRRPDNSEKSDIVINGIALTSQQLQRGVFNINIHVPNLHITINGRQDNSQPDITNLSSIGKAVYDLVNDVWIDSYRLIPSNAGVPVMDNDGSWYYNIRVEYTNINSNY